MKITKFMESRERLDDSIQMPPKAIDTVYEMVDFVDLVSNYTELSVENGHIFGDCPFCLAEKGMHINPEMGLYYCFKCKESGNSVQFAMKKESLKYKEALARLGEKYCKYDQVKETYKEYQKQSKERGKA